MMRTQCGRKKLRFSFRLVERHQLPGEVQYREYKTPDLEGSCREFFGGHALEPIRIPTKKRASGGRVLLHLVEMLGTTPDACSPQPTSEQQQSYRSARERIRLP